MQETSKYNQIGNCHSFFNSGFGYSQKPKFCYVQNEFEMRIKMKMMSLQTIFHLLFWDSKRFMKLQTNINITGNLCWFDMEWPTCKYLLFKFPVFLIGFSHILVSIRFFAGLLSIRLNYKIFEEIQTFLQLDIFSFLKDQLWYCITWSYFLDMRVITLNISLIPAIILTMRFFKIWKYFSSISDLEPFVIGIKKKCVDFESVFSSSFMQIKHDHVFFCNFNFSNPVSSSSSHLKLNNRSQHLQSIWNFELILE